MSTRTRRHHCRIFPISPFQSVSRRRTQRKGLGSGKNWEKATEMKWVFLKNEPFAVISVRRTGCREYSLASAKRTSFFTICSNAAPPPAPPAAMAAAVSSSSSWSSSAPQIWDGMGGGECRRRVGGGEGEGSACWFLFNNFVQLESCFGLYNMGRRSVRTYRATFADEWHDNN